MGNSSSRGLIYRRVFYLFREYSFPHLSKFHCSRLKSALEEVMSGGQYKCVLLLAFDFQGIMFTGLMARQGHSQSSCISTFLSIHLIIMNHRFKQMSSTESNLPISVHDDSPSRDIRQ